MKQQDHQAERILIGFCVAAYFVSYITRINYGTVLLEIVNSEGITKMAASMAVTGSFVTYGIGQLISGWLGRPDQAALSDVYRTDGLCRYECLCSTVFKTGRDACFLVYQRFCPGTDVASDGPAFVGLS